MVNDRIVIHPSQFILVRANACYNSNFRCEKTSFQNLAQQDILMTRNSKIAGLFGPKYFKISSLRKLPLCFIKILKSGRIEKHVIRSYNPGRYCIGSLKFDVVYTRASFAVVLIGEYTLGAICKAFRVFAGPSP